MMNSTEISKIMRERTLSDAELLKFGFAEYVDVNGNPSLRISEHQWKELHGDRERQIIKKIKDGINQSVKRTEEGREDSVKVTTDAGRHFDYDFLENGQAKFFLIWETWKEDHYIGDEKFTSKNDYLSVCLSLEEDLIFFKEYFRSTVPFDLGFWPTKEETEMAYARIDRISQERAEEFLQSGGHREGSFHKDCQAHIEISYSHDLISSGAFKVEDGKAVFDGQVPEDIREMITQAMEKKEVKVEFIEGESKSA